MGQGLSFEPTPTTRDDIRRWFEHGVSLGAVYMIVKCDTFDYEDYPVYVTPSDDFWAKHDSGEDSMQTVMETYDLRMDMESQLKEYRPHHEPPRHGGTGH